MASNIDNTVPAVDAALVSEPIRNNFIAAKSEIEALQGHDHNGGGGAQIAYSSLSGLPTLGKVLQVVYGSTTTLVTNNSQTYADTGVTATITPTATSSKILVLATIPLYCRFSTLASADTILLRGATTLSEKLYSPNSTSGEIIGDVVHNFLDTPATTSATVYKLQFRKSTAGSGSATVNDASNLATIVLMEIAE